MHIIYQMEVCVLRKIYVPPIWEHIIEGLCRVKYYMSIVY